MTLLQESATRVAALKLLEEYLDGTYKFDDSNMAGKIEVAKIVLQFTKPD